MPIDLKRWENNSQDRNLRNNTNKNWDILEKSHNDIEEKSEQALVESSAAKETADEANKLSNSVQTQLNTIVVKGDSSVEAAQARVDEDGNAHNNLKVRIDEGFRKHSTKINDLTKQTINVLTPPAPLMPAKADGETDDSAILKACHDIANSLGAKVVYPNASYLFGSVRNIVVNTPVDFSNSEIIIDQSISGQSVFTIPTTHEWKDIDLSVLNANKNQFQQNHSYVPILKDLVPEMSVIKLTYTVAGELTTDNTTRETISETSVHAQNGKLIGNIIHTPDTFIKAQYREMDSPVSMENMVVDLIGNLQTSFFALFHIERDNTTFNGIDVSRILASGSVRKDVFQYLSCYNSKLININAYNPKMTMMPYPADDTHFEGYILNAKECVELELNYFNVTTKHEPNWNVTTPTATWGAMGANHNKNVRIRNSHISRIDTHSPMNGLYIENSVVDWVQVCGTGNFYASNTTFMSSMNAPMINFFSSGVHTKLGNQWLGDIKFLNCTYMPMLQGTNYYLFFPGDTNLYKYKNYMPFVSLTIENLTIDMRYIDPANNPRIMLTYFAGDNPTTGMLGYLPQRIEMQNIIYRNTEPIFIPAIPVNSGNSSNNPVNNTLYLDRNLVKYNFRDIVFGEPTASTLYDGDILVNRNVAPADKKLELHYHNCRIPIMCAASLTSNVDFVVNNSEVNSIVSNRASTDHKGIMTFNSCYINLKSYGFGAYIPITVSAQTSKILRLNSCKINPYQMGLGYVKAITDILMSSLLMGIASNCYIDFNTVQAPDIPTVRSKLYVLNSLMPLGQFVPVPTTSSATGNPGDWSADATYLYICHATNTWKRVVTSTW